MYSGEELLGSSEAVREAPPSPGRRKSFESVVGKQSGQRTKLHSAAGGHFGEAGDGGGDGDGGGGGSGDGGDGDGGGGRVEQIKWDLTVAIPPPPPQEERGEYNYHESVAPTRPDLHLMVFKRAPYTGAGTGSGSGSGNGARARARARAGAGAAAGGNTGADAGAGAGGHDELVGVLRVDVSDADALGRLPASSMDPKAWQRLGTRENPNPGDSDAVREAILRWVKEEYVMLGDEHHPR